MIAFLQLRGVLLLFHTTSADSFALLCITLLYGTARCCVYSRRVFELISENVEAPRDALWYALGCSLFVNSGSNCSTEVMSLCRRCLVCLLFSSVNANGGSLTKKGREVLAFSYLDETKFRRHAFQVDCCTPYSVTVTAG